MQVPFRVRLRLINKVKVEFNELIASKKWHDLELIHIHQPFVG